MVSAVPVCALAFAAAFVITALTRRFATAAALIDKPNARSSHSAPTPRGGGISIVLVTCIAVAVLAARGELSSGEVLAIGIGGFAVALLGLFDDRFGLPVSLRFPLQFALSVWAVAWIGGLPVHGLSDPPPWLEMLAFPLAVLAVLWSLNLFNFMDGIDGLAASEGAFIALAAAALGHWVGVSAGLTITCAAVGGACLGFLSWNWPPARIFMGDVGSSYLGYVLAVMALAVSQDRPILLLAWFVLGALFIVDATVTLLVRLARRQRIMEAHRSHAYQILARRAGAHVKVTAAALTLNLVWLLPLAVLVVKQPRLAMGFAVVAVAAILLLVALTGAGTRRGES
jgi:Fuc2NAc and GlcNAc transferase